MINLKRHGYVYEITNLINGKMYIGKHSSSVFQPNYKGSGAGIKAAVKKYGWEGNFRVRILKWCYSEEELLLEERRIIAERKALTSPRYYNRSEGGEGMAGYRIGEEHKENIRNSKYRGGSDKKSTVTLPRPTVNRSTGYFGVYYSKYGNRYMAFLRLKTGYNGDVGEAYSRSFYVEQHGDELARELAAKAFDELLTTYAPSVTHRNFVDGKLSDLLLQKRTARLPIGVRDRRREKRSSMASEQRPYAAVVYWLKGKKQHQRRFGFYETPEEAGYVRDMGVIELHGKGVLDMANFTLNHEELRTDPTIPLRDLL